MFASAVILVVLLTSGCLKEKSAEKGNGDSSDSAKSATPAGQASITVTCGLASSCHATNTEWTLAKLGQVNGAQVTWSVSATPGAESHAILTFDGSLGVTNTGSANATISNIVVNLQKKTGANKYVTAASNIANSTAGDGAITAKICSGASSESFSSFNESAGSGSLEFRDESDNTIFSLVPQKSLPPGAAANLLYTAAFDATALGVNQNDIVRVEAIVTFGNAGDRGGSGASCANVDANGSGALDKDEANVRSVPCRTTITIPAKERSNASVVVNDDATGVSTVGTAAFSDFATELGGGSGTETTAVSIARATSLTAHPGTDGGSITNCASLSAETQPLCNPPAQARACDTQKIAAPVVAGFETGDFCTYTQGGWGAKPNGNNPGTILAAGFATAYPTGVEVGVKGTAGFSAKFSAATKVEAYLPAGGTSNALNADLLNPTKTSGGVFAGQVLALQLNVDFSRLALTAGSKGSVGNLVLQGTGGGLDGMTVSQILDAANVALGGGLLPNGMTYSGVNDVVTKLNEAFDGCSVTDWANQHLTR